MALNLNHQTAAEFAARLRTRYLNAEKVECARIAKWVLDHIDAGDFTALQVRNAFGLTAGQWTTLQTKLTNLRTAYNAVLAAKGE
jgi:plasmid maintenance system antidote protein VapI